jgi:hypothetical protein
LVEICELSSLCGFARNNLNRVADFVLHSKPSLAATGGDTSRNHSSESIFGGSGLQGSQPSDSEEESCWFNSRQLATAKRPKKVFEV